MKKTQVSRARPGGARGLSKKIALGARERPARPGTGSRAMREPGGCGGGKRGCKPEPLLPAEPRSGGAPRVRSLWQVCSRSSEVWSCQTADARLLRSSAWELELSGGRHVFAREVFPGGSGEIMKQLPTRHPRSHSQSDLSVQSPGGCGTRCGRGCSHWSEANPGLLGGSARRGCRTCPGRNLPAYKVGPVRSPGWAPQKALDEVVVPPHCMTPSSATNE